MKLKQVDCFVIQAASWVRVHNFNVTGHCDINILGIRPLVLKFWGISETINGIYFPKICSDLNIFQLMIHKIFSFLPITPVKSLDKHFFILIISKQAGTELCQAQLSLSWYF